MYQSTHYFLVLLITFVASSKAESVNIKDYFNQSKIKQWWIEKHYPASTTIVNDPSQISSSASFEFCVPFHTCSTNLNRTILVKHELDVEKLRRLQQYQYVASSVRNQGFLV
ncbi:unnamed protein product [Rotaria sp. Silwood2]|nr:unnamed protein product [Rotaria sp. Silwood2]CAF2913132.1 unnamed protein product [Rotaria sp. Silwood2]CAF3948511.1 unnamed protein product [Rotaria sp. Silwood2]CAF4203448.1 unnamed protein product [Rotaria sp. Silwood2]CAF4276292.1 unnamed protein product [Rotaria sp. Silwood2]